MDNGRMNILIKKMNQILYGKGDFQDLPIYACVNSPAGNDALVVEYLLAVTGDLTRFLPEICKVFYSTI